MAKKKTKSKKKIPKFQCCGNEDSKCNNKKVEVFVCPKCQSVEVGYEFGLKNIFGVIPRMKCKSCGFSATTFPKWFIDKTKLNKKHKKIDKKKKTNKTKRANSKMKIEEKYCPNCDDKVTVTMKDGSVDTFICENCKFEIKRRKKKK